MTEQIRILHVEDDPDFADLTATLLERENDRFTVEAVAHPSDGLDRLANGDVDCIVSDYDLSRGNGIEFLETVREDHPGLPFILFTGMGSEEVASEAISAGITDYLQKEGGIDQYTVLANRIKNAVDRYRAERGFEEMKQALETILENVPLVLYLFDETGTVIRSQGRALSQLGFQPDEIVGESVYEVFADRPEIIDHYERALDGEHVEDVVEVGDVVFQSWYQPLHSPGGAITGVVGHSVDITDRIENERQLARYGRILERLQETTQTLLKAADADEAAEIVVESLENVLEFDVAGMWLSTDARDRLEPVAITEAGRELFDTPPTYTAETESLSWEAFEKSRTRILDDLYDHDERYNQETALRSELIVPLGQYGLLNIGATEPGTFTEADATLVELWADTVTMVFARIERERQLREREKEVAQERDRLDEFASFVSHDLRNPLSVAMLRLDLAAEKYDSEHLDAVEGALVRMEQLIEDLLTLARQGETVGETSEVYLSSIVRRCWSNVETTDATLKCHTDSSISADGNRLAAAFENFFRNSIEHGGEDVTITVDDLPDGTGFYVADDGPGIPEDERDRVFETGYSSTDDGTGFGLAIVREVVTAHGWELHVTESESGGARFEVTGVEFIR